MSTVVVLFSDMNVCTIKYSLLLTNYCYRIFVDNHDVLDEMHVP